jgi:dUTP pyrophosphatase
MEFYKTIFSAIKGSASISIKRIRDHIRQFVVPPKQRYVLRVKVSAEEKDEYEKLTKYYSEFKNHYDGDAGVDLLFNGNVAVYKSPTLADFGIQCEMYDKFTERLVSYKIVPRSSIYKYGVVMTNSVGIIDANYRGTLMAPIHNITTDFGGGKDLSNKRLFQIISPTLDPITVDVVDELTGSERGANGFGSTGEN